jgi:hypothetical protein
MIASRLLLIRRAQVFHRAASDRTHTQMLGANTMPKELKNKREEKKKATLTPKEKKAAKRSKKESKRV